MSFRQSPPRVAGFCMRVQEEAMSKALSLFSFISWEVLENVFPIPNAKFVSAGVQGYPVIVLVEMPDLDRGEIQHDQMAVISVREPMADLLTITEWAKNNDFEMNVIRLSPEGCIFTLDDLFVTQIMFVPFR